MCDFSEITRLRRDLMMEGISFYELEEAPSLDEFFVSPTKSWARVTMRSERISVQDLKKGTIYEDLESKGEKKEDIEKKIKAMFLEAKLEESRSNKMNSGMTYEEAVKLSKQRRAEKDEMEIYSLAYLDSQSEAALKDKEMLRGLDKKDFKKLAKIQKQKFLEKRLAEKNRPYMGWPSPSPSSR